MVTSPPYWGGLRDYGVAGQVGLERQPSDYVDALVGVFSEARRVLRADGSFWLNVGDVYAASGKGGGGNQGDRPAWATVKARKGFRMPPAGYKMKDLTLVAFQLADALRRNGWYLRSTIIWKKQSAVEPMRFDRPAVSHEYIFLLAPSEQYYARNPGEKWWGHSVWEIPVERSAEHPAAFPTELARRCIACGTRQGDTVLDPFSGHGTTGVAAQQSGRNAILCELNPEYAEKARKRIESDWSG
jgi:DNA modification methylase